MIVRKGFGKAGVRRRLVVFACLLYIPNCVCILERNWLCILASSVH
jgi:hypothetical protein